MKKIQTERFYKMDKALQLVEDTNVAALWAHLIDAYNFFVEKEMVVTELTIFQSAKTIQAFTGIGVKAQATARKRLEELGFLKFRVAAIPGQATKSTFYILYPAAYKKWTEEHDFDKLRDEKYHELQDSAEREKLDQWIKDNMKDDQKQTLDRMNQKQKSLGTFANHTLGHLQTHPTDICNTPKDTVIETEVIETSQVEKTQSNEVSCVYRGEPYKYLKGKTKEELLDMIIETYQTKILINHPNYNSMADFKEARYIGDLSNIEVKFLELSIEVAANLYIGILGYLDYLEEELLENPNRFTAAHKLENLLVSNRKQVLTRANVSRGDKVGARLHKPHRPLKSL